ncbi:MAG: selenocysteine-specific translation elongation factor [Candidatus Brocadiia bacterium]
MEQGASLTRFVVGTAGHIDHGKSTLVRRLTGIDPDRLEEEKQRGMTIDIGFAHIKLPDGRIIGFIDVPGHERFVKNMVAGATAVAAVMLVIAADDSVMPQTREHLAVLRFLDIREGLVALTKCDLVDDETLQLVRMDIQSFVKGTFLENKPIIPVSAVTGQGIPELVAEIDAMSRRSVDRAARGVFRLPIQRVFSSAGFGTVVTGVPSSGKLKIGDTVEIRPGGKRGRVRGLQAYHRDVDEVIAGHSSAVNIADLHKDDVVRGMVVGTPGYLNEAADFEVHLTFLPPAPEIRLKDFAEITFHAGASEESGKIALFGGAKSLGAGEEAFAQIRLDHPVAVWPGMRFIIRRPSPADTLGGGVVLSATGVRPKRSSPEVVSFCEKRKAAVSDPEALAGLFIEEADLKPVSFDRICAETGLLPIELKPVLDAAISEGRIAEVGKGQFAAACNLSRAAELLCDSVEKLHQEKPLSFHFELSALRSSYPMEDVVFDEAIRILTRSGRIESSDGKVRKSGYAPPLSRKQVAHIERLTSELRADPYDAHKPHVVAEKWGVPAGELDEIYRVLIQQGEIVQLPDGVYLLKGAVEEAERRLRKFFESSDVLRSGDFKDIINSARKTAIALLDHFEKTGVTIRRGNEHSLRKFGGKSKN